MRKKDLLTPSWVIGPVLPSRVEVAEVPVDGKGGARPRPAEALGRASGALDPLPAEGIVSPAAVTAGEEF
jgi:hypothetical protein